jgi:hypothetical protein
MAQVLLAASMSGTVTDAAGAPAQGARIDHIGKRVIVAPAAEPDGLVTDVRGHFEVVTEAPAFVVRKPGYESQRVAVTPDAKLEIRIERIKPRICQIDKLPQVKTKPLNDADYLATLYYIETKTGKPGILSGHGPMYSWGAPSDSDVWWSLDYCEVMYENGSVDARGRTAERGYWRSITSFGEATGYRNVDKASAEILDCIMDQRFAPKR